MKQLMALRGGFSLKISFFIFRVAERAVPRDCCFRISACSAMIALVAGNSPTTKTARISKEGYLLIASHWHLFRQRHR